MKGTETAPRQEAWWAGQAAEQPPPSLSSQVAGLFISVYICELPRHIISHISASILISNVASDTQYQTG